MQLTDEVETMMSHREIPWHRAGTIVNEAPNAKEALVLAGLDWDVDLWPLYAHDPRNLARQSELEAPISVDGEFAVIRDNDLSVLGTVKGKYTPIQNRRSFEFFDALVDTGDAKYETAGSLRDGKLVFMTMHVPKEIKIGGVDAVNLYMALATSHDGSLAFTVMVTPVRIVCVNTLNFGLRRATQQWSIRHTESADGKIDEARKALGMTFSYAEAFETQANELIEAEYSKAEFEALVKKLVPSKTPDDTGRQVQMAMIGTLEASSTLDDSFRYTKWGALNAVAEYVDWIRPMRSSKTRSPGEQRVEAMWFGPTKKLKQDALEILTA